MKRRPRPWMRRLCLTATLAGSLARAETIEDSLSESAPAAPAAVAVVEAEEPGASWIEAAEVIRAALGLEINAATGRQLLAAYVQVLDPRGGLLDDMADAEPAGAGDADADAEEPALTCTRWPHELLYLRLAHLDSPQALAEALASLTGAGEAPLSGVILDVRGAGGTQWEAVPRLAGCFAPPESLLFTLAERETGAAVETVRAAPAEWTWRAPLMILIDDQTRGAPEQLAVGLRAAAPGAVLIGEPTAGDPGIREVVALPPPWPAARLARRVLITPQGQRLDGTEGLTPDIRVTRFQTVRPEAAEDEPDESDLPGAQTDRALRRLVGGDAVLQRAVDLLRGLHALNIRMPQDVPNHPD